MFRFFALIAFIIAGYMFMAWSGGLGFFLFVIYFTIFIAIAWILKRFVVDFRKNEMIIHENSTEFSETDGEILSEIQVSRIWYFLIVALISTNQAMLIFEVFDGLVLVRLFILFVIFLCFAVFFDQKNKNIKPENNTTWDVSPRNIQERLVPEILLSRLFYVMLIAYICITLIASILVYFLRFKFVLGPYWVAIVDIFTTTAFSCYILFLLIGFMRYSFFKSIYEFPSFDLKTLVYTGLALALGVVSILVFDILEWWLMVTYLSSIYFQIGVS